MSSSRGTRVFGLFILVACLAVIGGGGWYFWGRDYFADDDSASDDDTDEATPGVDAGAHGAKHPGGGKRHGKKGGSGGSRKSASVVHHGGGDSPPPAQLPSYSGPGGPSYESAVGGNVQQIAIGAAAGAPDLTDNQLAGPMRNGTFLGACGAPDSTHVTVKVAIRGGRAAGVSVYTNPPSPQIGWCIDHAVRNLAWPVSAKMDSFVTTY